MCVCLAMGCVWRKVRSVDRVGGMFTCCKKRLA